MPISSGLLRWNRTAKTKIRTAMSVEKTTRPPRAKRKTWSTDRATSDAGSGKNGTVGHMSGSALLLAAEHHEEKAPEDGEGQDPGAAHEAHHSRGIAARFRIVVVTEEE